MSTFNTRAAVSTAVQTGDPAVRTRSLQGTSQVPGFPQTAAFCTRLRKLTHGGTRGTACPLKWPELPNHQPPRSCQHTWLSASETPSVTQARTVSLRGHPTAGEHGVLLLMVGARALKRESAARAQHSRQTAHCSGSAWGSSPGRHFLEYCGVSEDPHYSVFFKNKCW